MYDTIIVGAGPAGMTTAIYLSRAGKKVLLLEQLAAGGQAALTHNIDNYPGFSEGINGFDLADKFQAQAQRFGAEFEYDGVEKIEFDEIQKKYSVSTSLGNTFYSKTTLVATGSTAKRLGTKGEDVYFGNGIGTCAVCDGAFYKDRIVAVIGGGNSALEEAHYLAGIAKKVYVIHRRDEFRADQYVIDLAKSAENIEFILDTVVEEYSGDTQLKSMYLKNVKTNKISELEINGVFLYVGLIPNTTFLDDKYKNEQGFVKISNKNEVNKQGLFAAGDCCADTIRQVVVACGEGVKASYEINHYLSIL